MAQDRKRRVTRENGKIPYCKYCGKQLSHHKSFGPTIHCASCRDMFIDDDISLGLFEEIQAVKVHK